MKDSREILLQRMQAVISDQPDVVAVQEKSRQITYDEFGKMVGAYRAALQATDPDGQSPVGLLLDRSAEAYAAMWFSCRTNSRPYKISKIIKRKTRHHCI